MRRQDRTRRTHLLHTEPEQNLHFSGISDIKSSLAPQSQAGEHESEERDGINPRGIWAPTGFIFRMLFLTFSISILTYVKPSVTEYEMCPVVRAVHLRCFCATDGNIHNLSSDISFPFGCREPQT